MTLGSEQGDREEEEGESRVVGWWRGPWSGDTNPSMEQDEWRKGGGESGQDGGC